MKKTLIMIKTIVCAITIIGCGGGPDPVQDDIDPSTGAGSTAGGTTGAGTGTGTGTGNAGTGTGTGTGGSGDPTGVLSGTGTGTTGTGTAGTGTSSGTGTGTGTTGTGTAGTGTGTTGTGTGTTGTTGTGTGAGTGTGTAGTGTGTGNVTRGNAGVITTGAANYTVQRGDTLANIASRRYGANNMDYFPLIRLVNARIIPNPDVIEPGLVIVIPNLQTNLNDSEVRAALKIEMNSTAARYDGRYPQAAARLRALANSL